MCCGDINNLCVCCCLLQNVCYIYDTGKCNASVLCRRDKRKDGTQHKSPPHEMTVLGGRESSWFDTSYEEESNMEISEQAFKLTHILLQQVNNYHPDNIVNSAA